MRPILWQRPESAFLCQVNEGAPLALGERPHSAVLLPSKEPVRGNKPTLPVSTVDVDGKPAFKRVYRLDAERGMGALR